MQQRVYGHFNNGVTEVKLLWQCLVLVIL